MHKKPEKKTNSPLPDAEGPQVFAVEIKQGEASFTRRDFLKAAGVATAASLAGCAPEPTPEPTATSIPTATPTPIPTATPAPTLAPGQLAKCRDARAHIGSVGHLAISKDGSLLASSGWMDNTIKVWLLPFGALLLTLEIGTDEPLNSLIISPDKMYLAAGNVDFIKFWSLPDGVLRHTFDTFGYSMAVSPDGSTLASGYGEKIKLWSLSDGKLLNTLEGHNVLARGLLFSPDGSSLIVIDRDEIGVLSYPDGALIQTLVGGEKNWEATINLDGSLIAVDTGDGVQVWSLPEGVLLQTIEVDTITSTFFSNKPAISPNGSLLLVGTGGQDAEKIEHWSLPEGKRLRTLMHSSKGHTSLAVSPDGTLLVSGGRDGTIKLWSLPYGEPVSCPMDLAINDTDVEGVSYEVTNDAGGVRTITLPCGSPIPAGAVCTCNCVAGGMCSCVGHSCTCDGHSSGGHYWHPN